MLVSGVFEVFSISQMYKLHERGSGWGGGRWGCEGLEFSNQ